MVTERWSQTTVARLIMLLTLLLAVASTSRSECPCNTVTRPVSRQISSAQVQAENRRSDYAIPPGFTAVGDAHDPGTLLPLRVRHLQTAYELVLVPAGTYIIGGAVPGQGSADHPQTYVQLRPFWIGVTEVTCVQAGRGGNATEGREPWVGVTWHEASRWAAANGMRLPTEAEWEVASRGADGRRFPWGDRAGEPQTAISPVGQRPAEASPFGCLDMLGNAGEWCNDWYDPTYYNRLTLGVVPSGPEYSPRSAKVVRGMSPARTAGTMLRQYLRPEERSRDVGFRPALTPSIRSQG